VSPQHPPPLETQQQIIDDAPLVAPTNFPEISLTINPDPPTTSYSTVVSVIAPIPSPTPDDAPGRTLPGTRKPQHKRKKPKHNLNSDLSALGTANSHTSTPAHVELSPPTPPELPNLATVAPDAQTPDQTAPSPLTSKIVSFCHRGRRNKRRIQRQPLDVTPHDK